jgi:hypothetical protein
MQNVAILLLMTGVLVSCSSILPSRSYSDIMEETEEPFWKPGNDFPIVAGDSGKVGLSMDELQERSPENPKAAFYRTEEQYAARELRYLESTLTEERLKDYQQVDSLLGTTERKLYYLKLSDEEKESYIGVLRNGTYGTSGGRFPASKTMATDYPSFEEQRDTFKSHLIDAVKSYRGDVYLGMKKEEVLDQWGQPDMVEVAGNPKFENERWTFRSKQGVSILFFESGKVRGWQQN